MKESEVWSEKKKKIQGPHNGISWVLKNAYIYIPRNNRVKLPYMRNA